ncbi:MAG: DoxX [Pedosphaera sp.]|nr:DoxX [Pedosphaera sp.]
MTVEKANAVRQAREMESNPNREATMNPRWTGLAKFSSAYLRLALGISFLSAVTDRSGVWGVYGQSHVAWGNCSRFVNYILLSSIGFCQQR